MSIDSESIQNEPNAIEARPGSLNDLLVSSSPGREVRPLPLRRGDDAHTAPITAHIVEGTVTDRSANISLTNSLGEEKVYSWHFPQQNEMEHIFGEIFPGQEYQWTPQTAYPRIIDLGSHIGLSVLYWKAVAPEARVIAVEASPTNYADLSTNIQSNGLTGVETIAAAVAGEEGQIVLHVHKPSSELSWRPNFAGREPYDSNRYDDVTVPAVTLSSLIGDERVDLLKIDIEGIEGAVLKEVAASGKLSLVDEIIMEFHNYDGNPENNLQEVLQILSDAGFAIKRAHKRDKPVDMQTIKPEDNISFVIHAVRS